MIRYWCSSPQYGRPSETTFWMGLKDAGDGYVVGRCMKHSELDVPLSRIGQMQALSGGEHFQARLKLDARNRYIEQHERQHLSRIEIVKQLFGSFINRSQAYDYPNEIGLVLFGTDVEVTCALSPSYEDFREKVEKASTSGDKRLYDAVDKAANELEEWRKRQQAAAAASDNDSDAALRILVLSDGADTKSQ